jgi:hypothetical protein
MINADGFIAAENAEIDMFFFATVVFSPVDFSVMKRIAGKLIADCR